MAIEDASNRSSTDLHRQLLDCSIDPIFCFAPDFRYLYANQAFADGVGRNLEEILGRTLWEVFTKDEADKRATLVKWVFDHGEAKAHEILVKGRHGTRHYLTTVTPTFGDQGRVRSVMANSKDITIRKQAESVVKASEEKYRALVETTSTGFLILDTEGKVIDANAEYVRLAGCSDLREILGRSVLEWTADYEIERNRRAVTQCARDGFIRNLEIDYVDRKGQTTPIEINATVIGEGDCAQIISLCRDISERKLAQEVERQSEAYTRTILDSVPDQIAVIDPDGVIVQVNEPWRRFSLENSRQPGKPAPHTDVGTNYMAVCLASTGSRAADGKAAYAGIQAVLEGKLPRFSMDYPCHSPDQQRWFTMRVSPLEGNRCGAVIAHTNITERTQTELQLEATRERLQLALSGGELGFWDWNIPSSEVLYSEHWFTMLGLPVDESRLPLDSWIKLIHPDDLANVNAALESHLKGKAPTYECEHRVRHQDGRWLWLLDRGRVVEWDEGGSPVRAVGTFVDITERKLAEGDRRDQHELLQVVLATALDGYWLVDSQGKLLDMNDAACAMLGYTKQEAIGLRVSDVDVVDSQDMVEHRAQRMQIHGGDKFETRHRRKDGSIVHVEVSIRYLPSKSAFSVFIRDITQRKLSEAELQLAASVFDHAREGITITDTQGTIVDINETFTRITGYSREDAIGQNPRILKSGRQDAAFYETMWDALTTIGHWNGEIWNRRKNGEVYAELITISAVRDAQGNTLQYVALFSDITAMKEHQTQLEHIAHFDALTNLANRLLLADRLQQAMAQAQRRGNQIAVAYLDLDGFKGINDQHGHDVGDKLLIHLATAMKDTLREGDTLARLGGDEFVAVLIDLDGVEGCTPMLTRLLDAAAAPVQFGAVALQGSASLGVTFYPQSQEVEADQLLRQADQAMYQAKLAGKNRYHVFDAAHDSSVRVHHESLERIRLALKQREFVLHYQPKVNMRTGQVIGAEALIRWQHPEKGLLSPAKFLPVIEDHPLAVELGEWVIDMALTQIEAWHTTGLDIAVSVNIGARQLQQSNFVSRLQSILSMHPQVKPTSLELEVLETSALADMEQISQVIEDCQLMGVKFALDDFGTGYSSLTYLKRLRVAVLKVDQSFVRDMLDDPEDLAILEGVIGLAMAFKRDVVAEGVETVEHGTALLHLGCELAQGYGIARPMSAGQVLAWAASWQPDIAWSELPLFGGERFPMDA